MRSIQGSIESIILCSTFAPAEYVLAVWHQGKAAKELAERRKSRVLLGSGVVLQLQRVPDPLLGRITVVVERSQVPDMYM